jgi:hypothetical protein
VARRYDLGPGVITVKQPPFNPLLRPFEPMATRQMVELEAEAALVVGEAWLSSGRLV